MLPSETLWPTTRPPAFERVGSTQPFNYRDTLTLLDYVNQVVAHIESVQSDVNDDMTTIDGDLDMMQTALNGMLVDMDNLRDQLIAMISQAAASDNIMVRSPSYGGVVDVQRALGDMYDADRLFGLFTSDFDALNLSPAAFDALQVSPREFDLRSTDVINAVQGDATINDIWWLKDHGLTFGDLIRQAQDAAASATSAANTVSTSATSAAASSASASKSATMASTSAASAADSAKAVSDNMATLTLTHWVSDRSTAIARSTADPTGIYYAPEV